MSNQRQVTATEQQTSQPDLWEKSAGGNGPKKSERSEPEDNREKLELDAWHVSRFNQPTAADADNHLNAIVELLDRQAAITESEITNTWTDYNYAIETENDLLQGKLDKLTAELDAFKIREKTAEDYDFREPAQRWEQAFEDKCREVVLLTAERDDLKHTNSLLQSTIAELDLKVDEKQAELLESRAARNADPVEIQLALARFAEEWVLADTRVQEQRLITYHAQQIAQMVDNPAKEVMEQ